VSKSMQLIKELRNSRA